ncbi:MAG TPA: zinc ribbon domain-containing protein [Miltoncostaeaceae bacterium]|nr:zinc ribbon domain-containing protein [Miltoncostaeaceae bacterium]
MPTYDLACVACEHEFEAFRQGFLRDEDRVCPECGTDEARQRFTGFVTARPSRPPAPARAAAGGGCCGGSCGCGG